MMTDDLFRLVDSIARKEQELAALRRLLVQHQGSKTPVWGETTVLRCKLHGHAVALPVSEVQEVLRMPELTVLPDAFPWVMGLLRLGAERIPVVDLFGGTVERRACEPEDFIVLTDTQAGTLGLVMDAIDGISSFDASALARPLPDMPFGAHVLGVFDAEGESVLLLSPSPVSLAELSPEAEP